MGAVRRDGDWIASSREKWRLQDLGSRSGIIQSGIVLA
ncbi:hypothetical protein C7449_1164 [Mycoplana dimorpha]|uniref:Uncharacterized protein n=1 Tax=Mycoplana dimorpha TaxID=28320 RepID=A0A2T5AIY9_MYCDI|nr:hypothetical protein C7449_1164 [Mycoplana dimorpha]